MITYKCKHGHTWERNENHIVFCPVCGYIACSVTEISKMTVNEFMEVYGCVPINQ